MLEDGRRRKQAGHESVYRSAVGSSGCTLFTVRALRIAPGATPAVVEVPDPTVDAGWALVRVRLAGICRTDVELARGYMAFSGTIGHEFVGEVTAAPGAEEWIGRRVAGEINFSCGRCERCAQGLGRHCATRTVMGIVAADGAFAEFVRVPIANLHPVPDGVSDADAVFVEPLAAAFEILAQIPDLDGRRALVLGDGKLGMLVAQVLRNAGARTTLVGRHPEKLDRARALGIDCGPVVPNVDVVVDATGSADGLRTALDTVRPRGTVVLKTTVAAEHRLDLAPAVINEITLLGSRCGPFAPALAALASGAVRVDTLVDARYGLSDGAGALAHAARPGAFKILLDPTD